MIKIRMSRAGRKNSPLFTIVATEHTSARDGKFLEKLGQYDPASKEPLKGINVDGIKSWISSGAILSDTVRTLLKRQNITL